jgi:hypothetical protein
VLRQLDRDPSLAFAIDVGDMVEQGTLEQFETFFKQLRPAVRLRLSAQGQQAGLYTVAQVVVEFVQGGDRHVQELGELGGYRRTLGDVARWRATASRTVAEPVIRRRSGRKKCQYAAAQFADR